MKPEILNPDWKVKLWAPGEREEYLRRLDEHRDKHLTGKRCLICKTDIPREQWHPTTTSDDKLYVTYTTQCKCGKIYAVTYRAVSGKDEA